MPFNTEQLTYGAKHAIDWYAKNEPIDQINTAHPLYNMLIEGKQEYGGALQYVVEQLRYANDSNFQAFFGDSEVDYNRRRSLDQAKYTWAQFHDGFGLNESELIQNGLTVTEDLGAVPTADEKVTLTNLVKENHAIMKLGWQEKFDLMLHRDGTQNALELPGLDALVSLTPSVGTVGTLSCSNTWWQNHANTAINSTAAEGLAEMEAAWRACIRYGGEAPNKILAGSDFVDWYRTATTSVVSRQVTVGGSEGNRRGTVLDASVGNGISTGLYFKGVEIIWDPVFDVLDGLDSPTITWASRCYFLNTKYLKLRPIKGQWMKPRKPPRVYNRYVHYTAITAACSLTLSKRNCHAVLALA